MYTGTLIEDLMDAVERVEKQESTQRRQRERLDYWHVVAGNEAVRLESTLAGVA